MRVPTAQQEPDKSMSASLPMRSAPTQVQDIDPETVRHWLCKGEAMLIDVREEEEHAEEHIPGAALLPLSRFDPTLMPQTAEKKAVLHCLVGGRSLKAAKILAESGFQQVFHMDGGLLAWVAAGGETLKAP